VEYCSSDNLEQSAHFSTVVDMFSSASKSSASKTADIVSVKQYCDVVIQELSIAPYSVASYLAKYSVVGYRMRVLAHYSNPIKEDGGLNYEDDGRLTHEEEAGKDRKP